MKKFLLNVVLFQDKEHRNLSICFWIGMSILAGIVVCAFIGMNYFEHRTFGNTAALAAVWPLQFALVATIAIYLYLQYLNSLKDGNKNG